MFSSLSGTKSVTTLFGGGPHYSILKHVFNTKFTRSENQIMMFYVSLPVQRDGVSVTRTETSPTVHLSNGGQYSGWYASYWNAYLFYKWIFRLTSAAMYWRNICSEISQNKTVSRFHLWFIFTHSVFFTWMYWNIGRKMLLYYDRAENTPVFIFNKGEIFWDVERCN